MLTTRFGETNSSRLDERRQDEKTLREASLYGWESFGRWFDFEFREDGDIEVVEDGETVGRITGVYEAEDFIDWMTEDRP